MRLLHAPFPYFGGKSGAAAEVWARFGDVPNYVEPFAGSLAVLLARPHEPGVETINDMDGCVENFWRSVATDPDEVAYHADWPVSEIALHARHAYLVQRVPWLTDRLMGDPSFCDPRLAGWWVWGASAWIGTGWCSGQGPWTSRGGWLQLRAEIGNPGRGINRQLPHLGNPGHGINRQLPHLGDPGRGWTDQGAAIREWMFALQARLRRVRMPCGDFERVLTPVVTTRHGLTGVFLDPPYASGEMDYSAGGTGGEVAQRAAAWCREHGEDAGLRIALCGHDGDYDLPGWQTYAWKARGGYGNSGGEDADDNRHRETIWFSPHCLRANQLGLFETCPAKSSEAAP